MAKVLYQFGIGGIVGELDGGVHYRARRNGFGYMRRWVYPTLNAHNHEIGEVGANLGAFWNACTADFKADMVLYAQRYFTQNGDVEGWDPNRSPYAWLVKFMYNYYDSDPTHVDLSTIVPADMNAVGLDNIADIIVAGFLPAVDPYNDLSHPCA